MDERSNSRASDIIHQMVSYEHEYMMELSKAKYWGVIHRILKFPVPNYNVNKHDSKGKLLQQHKYMIFISHSEIE